MPVDVRTDRLSPEEVLEFLPQQKPFRFVDEILEVDEDHIVARYRFRSDADFYRGHFPGDPITPGVIPARVSGSGGGCGPGCLYLRPSIWA